MHLWWQILQIQISYNCSTQLEMGSTFGIQLITWLVNMGCGLAMHYGLMGFYTYCTTYLHSHVKKCYKYKLLLLVLN